MNTTGPISELVASLATLMFMAGGFCLIVQQKRWAGRWAIGGFALAVAAALVPAVVANTPHLWQVVGLVALALAFIFFAIGSLVRLLDRLWGKETTGHVVGTYLVRLLDNAFDRNHRIRHSQHTEVQTTSDSQRNNR